jgi:hypothetical protein
MNAARTVVSARYSVWGLASVRRGVRNRIQKTSAAGFRWLRPARPDWAFFHCAPVRGATFLRRFSQRSDHRSGCRGETSKLRSGASFRSRLSPRLHPENSPVCGRLPRRIEVQAASSLTRCYLATPSRIAGRVSKKRFPPRRARHFRWSIPEVFAGVRCAHLGSAIARVARVDEFVRRENCCVIETRKVKQR